MKQARSTEGLRKAIKERGLTHRELATLAECSRNTPYKLLCGRTTGDETAARLAKALRRDITELFDDAVSSNRQAHVNEGAVA